MSGLHIIWDLDGTLIDSEQEVMAALVRAVRSAGLSEKEQAAPFRVGPTIDRMLDAALSPEILTAQKKKEIIAAFRKEYDNCGFTNTSPFPGIEEILADKSLSHHIVTNKPDLATGRILEKLGWNGFFISVVTPYSFMRSPDEQKKTKVWLFSDCMGRQQRGDFVGIGDMASDALAAKEAGITALGVLWGTGTREELSVCDKTFADARELREYLAALRDSL